MGLAPGISGMAGCERSFAGRGTDDWSAPGVMLAGGNTAGEFEGGIAVVADARLDNHAALADRLGLPPDACAAAMIAAAYRAWDDRAPAHLAGTFAFALWDRARCRLLCARDLMGVRPFHFRREGGGLRFAQAADALAAAVDRTRTLRAEAVADFLYGRVLEPRGTWFAGVERLPAGHLLTFEPGGSGAVRIARYSAIAPAPFVPGTDAPAGLRDRLDAAVAATDDGAHVGALLSGGLDSSSIACLLRDQRRRAGGPPVPVFAMMFREPARSDERRHFDAVVATGGFEPHVLELDGYDPFAGFEALLAAMGGPTLTPNLAAMRHVMAAAAERGVDVLLDGHGGDEVVSHGYGLLDELAARGAWGQLWREARGAADNYGRSRLVLTRRVAARQRQRLDARIVAKLLAPFDREAAPAGERPFTHLLSRDLIRTGHLAERLRRFVRPEHVASEQGQHRAVLADPLQPYAFEVHAAFTRSMGLAARYPFWDRAVVEFCLGLPASEKLSRGWSRLVLRRAMRGIVPDSVLDRRDKIDFGVHLARGMVRHHHARLAHLFSSADSPLAPYVDLARACSAYAALAADPDAANGRTVQMLWRAAALGIWLETGCGAASTGAVRLREAAA